MTLLPLLPLELLQLLLPVLLQQVLELVPLLLPPLLSFFSFLLRLLLRLPLVLFLYSSTEWSPMGQVVRFATGEASTSSSMEWVSFESLSPPDPSLIVIGSP